MKKVSAFVAALICVFGMLPLGSVNAQEVSVRTVVEIMEVSEASGEIMPRADVIVWKYRKYNGLIQMRRWNETKGVWVDPEWITVSVRIAAYQAILELLDGTEGTLDIAV